MCVITLWSVRDNTLNNPWTRFELSVIFYLSVRANPFCLPDNTVQLKPLTGYNLIVRVARIKWHSANSSSRFIHTFTVKVLPRYGDTHKIFACFIRDMLSDKLPLINKIKARVTRAIFFSRRQRVGIKHGSGINEIQNCGSGKRDKTRKKG